MSDGHMDEPKIQTMTHADAETIRLHALARLISAEKMWLVNDPTGANLPDDLWMQELGSATAVFLLLRKGRRGDGGI